MLLTLMLCLIIWLGGVTDSKAQPIIHGDYQIHYTTFASTLIPPEVAEAHKLVRAENQVVLNVSVMRQGEPAAVQLEGTVTNLLNQLTQLEFNEVNEQDAIYYLAHHPAAERDILRFAIIIHFADETLLPYQLNFVRQY